MKAELIQISWHTKEPVFSIDFHSSGRFATSGGDNAIRIWSFLPDGSLQLLSSLIRHSAPVNCVRFSPDSNLLASGSDDGFVILWKLNDNSSQNDKISLKPLTDSDDPPNIEEWSVVKAIHANKKDIYDISWSLDSTNFITGSTDNSAAVWKINNPQALCVFNDHFHFVQGVSWDPLGKLIATQSSDRTVRIYKRKSPTSKEFTTFHVLNYLEFNEIKDEQKDENLSGDTINNNTTPKKWKIYNSDTVGSFFRRLCWSPDGILLFTPCAIWQDSPNTKQYNTTLVWSRHDFSKPLLQIPSGLDPSLIVKCHPNLYELEKNSNDEIYPSPWFDLPYRIIFAIATKTSVQIYDTQHPNAIGNIGNYHLASLTDIAWSEDGTVLMISSRDAFCSKVIFSDGELGTKYNK